MEGRRTWKTPRSGAGVPSGDYAAPLPSGERSSPGPRSRPSRGGMRWVGESPLASSNATRIGFRSGRLWSAEAATCLSARKARRDGREQHRMNPSRGGRPRRTAFSSCYPNARLHAISNPNLPPRTLDDERSVGPASLRHASGELAEQYAGPTPRGRCNPTRATLRGPSCRRPRTGPPPKPPTGNQPVNRNTGGWPVARA
jgi:hypothetical protein